MVGFAGSSFALFAAAWGLMCVLASAVVTDALLRGGDLPEALDGETASGVPVEEA